MFPDTRVMFSVGSGTGVYRFPEMGWKTQQCKNKYLWGQKEHLTRLFFPSIYLRIFVSSHHHFLEYCWRIRYPGTKDFPVPATHTHKKKPNTSCLGVTLTLEIPWKYLVVRNHVTQRHMENLNHHSNTLNKLFREVVQIPASSFIDFKNQKWELGFFGFYSSILPR